jgi:hypothetical protein
VEYSHDRPYARTSSTETPKVGFDNIGNEIRLEKAKASLRHESHGHCAICRDPYDGRPLEAIACASIRLARQAGVACPSDVELVNLADSKPSGSEWNGAHVFHKSCLRQWIRTNALDASSKDVRCPECSTSFYDSDALNAVRFKLFSLEEGQEPTDETFDAKSFLRDRSSNFLVSTESSVKNLLQNVTKQMEYEAITRRSRSARDEDPFGLGKAADYVIPFENNRKTKAKELIDIILRDGSKVFDSTMSESGKRDCEDYGSCRAEYQETKRIRHYDDYDDDDCTGAAAAFGSASNAPHTSTSSTIFSLAS